MSNSEDIDAIDMFVKGKMSLVATHPPLGAVIDEWNTFAKSVKGSWWISDADVAKAKLIRDRINAAAGEADLVALGFKPADNPAYQVPLDQILGKTGAEIAAAEKKQTALRESTAQKQPLLDVGSKDKRAIMIAQSIVGVKPTGIYDVKITKPAVVKWQKMRKINPASGKFGPLSWASAGISDVQLVAAKDPIASVAPPLPPMPEPAFAPPPPAAVPPKPVIAATPKKPVVVGKVPVTALPGPAGTTTAHTTALEAGFVSGLPWWGKAIAALGIGGAIFAATKPKMLKGR